MVNPTFLQIQQDYQLMKITSIKGLDNNDTTLELAITNLDNAIQGGNTDIIRQAFIPIGDYYANILKVNKELRQYINSAADSINNSNPRLLNEERYTNRVYPEKSMLARETIGGLIPELRVTSLPYLLAASTFMAFLSIFLIFQMFGFSGQVNIPLSLTEWLSSPASSVPFYKNPMILGGISIIAVVSCIIFAILYYQAKNTNSR